MRLEYAPGMTSEDMTIRLEAPPAAASAGRPGGGVALVGAGPGDPELLTVKALRLIRAADVLLADNLVSPEILRLAGPQTRLVRVGKTGHGPSWRQADINALIVQHALLGRRVVRLKGGDPSIFGRAGEEIEACRAAGVPVEIVPGITSAQGAAASLTLSLTHRDHARRVQFVTAHDRDGVVPADLSWTDLADPAVTTVVYMPRRTLADLAHRALEAGLDPATPAVAVVSATRPDERIVRGCIADIAERLALEGGEGPAIVLIGRAMACDEADLLKGARERAAAPVAATAGRAR